LGHLAFEFLMREENAMSNESDKQSRFVTCRCQHCDGHIEFDASGFAKGETRNVECPHCLQDTNISVPDSMPKKQPENKTLLLSFMQFFRKVDWVQTLLTGRTTLARKLKSGDRKWIFSLLAVAIVAVVVIFGINTKWTKSDTVRKGDVQISVIELFARYGPVYGPGPEGFVVTKPAGLTMTVNVKNLSSTKKMDFTTWRVKPSSSNKDYASLSDSSGNSYKQIVLESVLQDTGDDASIYPGKSFDDLIMFQVPVDNIQWLHLELPAANFGGWGTLRFEIPASRIKSN